MTTTSASLMWDRQLLRWLLAIPASWYSHPVPSPPLTRRLDLTARS